jgi:RNA polymerase sigma-70 factor (ECF subfamily)
VTIPRKPDVSEPPGLCQQENFAWVFDRYFGEVHGYVARRLGTHEADDIAAETFTIAFRKRASYDAASGSVRAWLYGIATREIGHHRRAEMRAYRALERATADLHEEDPQDRVAERVTATAAQGRLAAALAGLSPGDRDVLLLVALAGLSHAEVATALDIPYGTVGSRLNRARKQLRAALGGVSPADYREDWRHG